MKIEFDAVQEVMTIDGVQFSFESLKTFTEPKRGWFYQFERRGEFVIVHSFHPSVIDLKPGIEAQLATYEEVK